MSTSLRPDRDPIGVDTTCVFQPALSDDDPTVLHADMLRTPLSKLAFEPGEGEDEDEDDPDPAVISFDPGGDRDYEFHPPRFEVHAGGDGGVTIICILAPCGMTIENGGLMASALATFGVYRHSMVSPALHHVHPARADEAITWWTRLIAHHGESLDCFPGWQRAVESLRARMLDEEL